MLNPTALCDSVEAACAEVAKVVDGADGLIISDYGLGDIGPKVRSITYGAFCCQPDLRRLSLCIGWLSRSPSSYTQYS